MLAGLEKCGGCARGIGCAAGIREEGSMSEPEVCATGVEEDGERFWGGADVELEEEIAGGKEFQGDGRVVAD